MGKRQIYKKSERWPVSEPITKVSQDFYPRNQKKRVNSPSKSVLEPRDGRNYFRGECMTWATKSERSKLLKKYEEWDLRYPGRAMSFRQVDEWGRFIEHQEWQFFATFTTRHTLTAKSARRAIEKWCEILSKDLNFSYSPDSFRCFWVTEPFAKDGKDGVHIHALISLPHYWRKAELEKSAYLILLDTWQRVTGGRRFGSGLVEGNWNRVKIDPYKGVSASRYTMKYLTKSLVDWDYFCTFSNKEEEAN